MKGKLALLLILTIILTSFSPLLTSFASVSEDIQEKKAYNGNIFESDSLWNSGVSATQIKEYLVSQGNSPFSSNGGYVLNPYVYKKYKIIVYTDAGALSKGNDHEKAGLSTEGMALKETQNGENKSEIVYEYRYLGYDETGNTLITNDFYPADSKTITDPRTRSWIFNDAKLKTWNEELRDNPSMLYYLLKTDLLNDDIESGRFIQRDYSIADITNKGDYNTLMKFPKLLQTPTFREVGVLNMVHKSRSNGKRWYDTMRLDQFSYNLTTSIQAEEIKRLPVGTTTYDIPYTVTSTISDMKTDKISNDGKYINEITLTSNGTHELFTNIKNRNEKLPNLNKSLTKTVDLRGLKPNVEKTVTIEATTSVTTFEGANRTKSAKPATVKIILVADDVVDFIAKYKETDVTDGNIVVDNIANPNATIALDDTSFVESADITQHIFKVKFPTEDRTISGGNNDTTTYTITGANKACIIDGYVTFIEIVMTEDGVVGSAEHKVKIDEKTPINTSNDVVAVLTSTAEFNEDKERYEVMEGERFYLKGNKSYHKAGLKLKEYIFDIGESFGEGILTKNYGKRIKMFYPKSDGNTVYDAYLTVTDEAGKSDETSISTKVYPARFDPKIELDGTLKENRKFTVTVSNENRRLFYYPIDETSLRWTVTPLDGQTGAINIDGSLSGSDTIDLQCAEKGRYKIHVTGEISSNYNPIRYRGEVEIIVTISEDLPPVTNFVSQSFMYRDIENGNVTKIYANDQSESLDNDRIVQRIWSIKFDSNNDGDFDDEIAQVISAGNETSVYFETSHVGKYLFELKTKEEFGQETITRFITDADKRRGDTSKKALDEKVTELGNVPPVIELELSQRKKVHAIIYEDLNSTEKANLESKLTELRGSLLAKKIELETHYLSPTLSVGTKTINKVNFDTYLYFNVYVRGEYESGTGRKSNVRGTKTIKIFLDSFSTNGEIPTQSNEGRFELVSVTHNENAGESHSLEDSDGRDEEDWWDTDRFNIQYKDRGVLKRIYYDFSKEHSTWNDRASQSQSYDIDDVRLQSSGIVVDEPSFEGRTYNKANQAPVMNDGWLKWYTKGTSYERNVTLKKYNEASLDSILKDVGTDDAFFINMARKEENRLALSESLLDKLKDKNIHYKTLSEDALLTNPLSGRYDKVYLSNDVYLTIGNFIYQILDGKYILRGTLNQLKDIVKTKTFKEKFTMNHWSNYSVGGKYYTGGSAYIMKYGLEILNYQLGDSNNDYDNVYRSSDSDERSQLFNDPNYAKQVMGNNPPLWIEKDGNLVGYKMYLREDNYRKRYYSKKREEYYYVYTYIISKHTSAHILGSGYVNVLQGLTTMDDGFQMRGYVHSNGMIYFKKPSYSRHGISWSNYMTITEGTSNIDYIYYNEFQKSYYVFTKNKSLIKYDIINKKRTVLLTTYLERKGRSAKVDEDTIMLDGKLYEGYEEVYSDDGSAIANTYYRYTVTYMLDLEGNYTAVKKYYANRSQSEPTSEKTYILGKNVAYLPYRQNSYDDIWSLDLYVGEDDYMYKANNLNQMRSYNNPTDFVPVKFHWNPKKIRSTQYLSHNGVTGVQYLTWFEDGSLDLNDQNLTYANLTIGDKATVVSDGQLVSATPHSQSYNTLTLLSNSIMDLYSDYSTSENIVILLNETLEPKMIATDYENDPVYTMRLDSEHTNPNYYENSMGRDPNVGEGKGITQFNYVGQYKMIPRVRDNPVGNDDRFDNYRLWNQDDTWVNVFVHRRPLAFFTTSLHDSEGIMTLNAKDNGSYDLDNESKANKGIVKWEWSLKDEDGISWKHYYGKTLSIPTLSSNTTYYLALRVLDMEGAWSKPVIRKLEATGVPLTLTAKIKSMKNTFSPANIPITETLQLYDIETTYPKEVKLEAGFYKDDVLIGAEKEISFKENETGVTIDNVYGQKSWNPIKHVIGSTISDGHYTLKIRAIDKINTKKKEEMVFDVHVKTPINPIPEANNVWMTTQTESLSCKTSIYTNNVNVTLFKGSLHEETQAMNLQVTNQKKGEKTWILDYKIPESIENGLYTIDFTGVVHTQPKKKETASINVQVISLDFEEVILSGAWNHWRGQEDLFGKRLVEMPYRFLSWEKIYLTARTLGNPDKVTLKLSPELEAMSFTDNNGKTFYYKDDFESEVSFPLEFTKEGENLWTVSYILPLASSSLSWEDKRLRAPYEIIVTAYKDNITRVYEFNESKGRGIDITGNTTNLIYQQPVSNR